MKLVTEHSGSLVNPLGVGLGVKSLSLKGAQRSVECESERHFLRERTTLLEASTAYFQEQFF